MELLHPDRVKFTFMSDDEAYVYLCSKSSTEKETEERAGRAHKYFMEELEKISEDFSNHFIGSLEDKSSEDKGEKKEDNFSMMDGLKAAMNLQEQGEKLGVEIESNYQCLLVE